VELSEHVLDRIDEIVPPGGLSVPAHILKLRNTVRLHGALMDWQHESLDVALPGRAQLARADEEGDAHRRWLDVA
jgi:hypothetical protein